MSGTDVEPGADAQPDAALVLYTNPMSRGQTARWALEEIGRPYRVEQLEYGSTMKSPAYLAINPMGKVPALRHGDQVATEVGAICAYLADAFPEAGLAPTLGDRSRAPYHRWMYFAAGPLEAATTNAAFGFAAPDGADQRLGYGSLAAVADTLDQALSGRTHLVGDRFSMADLHLSATLGFLLAFKMIEARPSFSAFVDAHRNRPAAVRARALDAQAQG